MIRLCWPLMLLLAGCPAPEKKVRDDGSRNQVSS